MICAFFLCIIGILPLSAEQNNPPYVVAAYYENYSQWQKQGDGQPTFSPEMIDPNLLTDLYYAFGSFGYVAATVDPSHPHLTGDFTIQPTLANDQSTLYSQVMALKKRSKNDLKIFLSIGGWNFNDPQDPQGTGASTYRLFSKMVSTPSNRKQFIDSAIEYAHRYGFDGIDIDWEYPGDEKRGGQPEDFANFVAFLKECSTAFAKATPPLLLSMAAPALIPFNLPRRFHENPNTFFEWIAECAQYLDRVNIMAYDYHGPFNDPKITGANAPLMRDTNPDSDLYVEKTLQNYFKGGVPARKMVLGIPTFGRSYAGVQGLSESNYGPGKLFETAGPPGPATRLAGLLAYFEINEMRITKKLTVDIDAITNTAEGYHLPSQLWVSFDNPDTTKLKAQVAHDHSLRGVMFWTVNMDEYQKEPKYPNIRSGWNVFYPSR